MKLIHFLKTDKELRFFSVTGKFVRPEQKEAEDETEEEEVNGEIFEENMESVPISLSSSLIVSSTFAVLRRITVTNCGGATSVMNLANRELAITIFEI